MYVTILIFRELAWKGLDTHSGKASVWEVCCTVRTEALPDPLSDPALETRRQALLEQLAQLGDLRPGSLVERFKQCGRTSCSCSRPGARGHGPQWILTTKVAGKTRTRIIPPHALAETRAQIAECRRLRSLVAELVTVSEQLCHARLQAARRAPPGAGEKKPARRNAAPLLRPSSSVS